MRRIAIWLLIIVTVISIVPTKIDAVTLGEYEKIVADYQAEIDEIQSNIAKTEAEIKEAEKQIDEIKKETNRLLDEIKKLNEEIVAANEEIRTKSLQTKQLFEYLQLSSGENVYLEYIFGAESVTDLIYRSAVIEQLTEYNNKVIHDLETLIDANHRREEEINKRTKELEKNQKQLEEKIASLGEKKNSLGETGVTSAQQLKIYQDLVDAYKEQGCKSADVIGVDCANNGSAGPFRRPIEVGRITSSFGDRWGSFHRGLDMTNNHAYNYDTKVYPIGNGTIIAKFYDYYGALIVMISHYDAVSKKNYTSLYAHLDSFAPGIYVGKYVTSNDYIGIMGNTGYSFGVHLHLEVAPCVYLTDNVCSNWNKYTNFIANQARNHGFKGPEELVYFPSSWSAR